MGFHTYDVERAAELEDSSRYAFLSVDELLSLADLRADDVVADLGSGTGFYTDDVAAVADTVYAVDVQSAMHERYRAKGLPRTVRLLTAEVADLPLATDALTAAVSTMTYHEFASDAACAELARVVAPDGRLAIADWTSAGDGASGPPLDERYAAGEAAAHLEAAGFTVERADDRRETFVLAARR